MIRKLIEKIESKILTKLFIRWVSSEYDLELLAMTRRVIQKKEAKVKLLIDHINKVEITGFKRYDA